MTEEKSRTPEEMWADWARQELTDQAAELKELRRFKREAEKELRRFKKYSAALEKEVKTLRESLEKIKKKLENAPQSGLTIYHGANIYGECCDALEGYEK